MPCFSPLAPDRASYLTNMLPGFLLLGAGVGLVFVAVTVTAMADVGHEEAGLASGIMTTAHELGAALGVAVLAAVATSNGNPVSGYGNAFFVAAAIAALLAVVAAVALPPFDQRRGRTFRCTSDTATSHVRGLVRPRGVLECPPVGAGRAVAARGLGRPVCESGTRAPPGAPACVEWPGRQVWNGVPGGTSCSPLPPP